MKQLDLIQDDALVRQLQKKMAPPLVTLLSAEPEIQFVALRNINLIVQKAPQILSHEVKVRVAVHADTPPPRGGASSSFLTCAFGCWTSSLWPFATSV